MVHLLVALLSIILTINLIQIASLQIFLKYIHKYALHNHLITLPLFKQIEQKLHLPLSVFDFSIIFSFIFVVIVVNVKFLHQLQQQCKYEYMMLAQKKKMQLNKLLNTLYYQDDTILAYIA